MKTHIFAIVFLLIFLFFTSVGGRLLSRVILLVGGFGSLFLQLCNKTFRYRLGLF